VAIAFIQLTFFYQDPDMLRRALGFEKSDLGNSQWWSLVTYMFAHKGILHLFVNMLMLWFFGPRLEHSWGAASFTRLYIWCGLGGLLAHALLGGEGVLIGASAAIMGVMMAYAVSWPDEEIFLFGVIPMKVKWMVALFVAVNLASGIASFGDSGGGVAYFAHLGGILFALIYIRTPSPRGFDRIRNRVSLAPDDTDEPPRAVPRSITRNRERMSEIDEIVARSNAVSSRRGQMVSQQKADSSHDSSETLDLILDKISERGLESLTEAELKVLEQASKDLRKGS
jgi:membrane associated rhomboid family serine protease